MGIRDHFKKGDWNVICDVCGFKFKGSELQKRWDGFMVCKQDWEPRPPQEYIRGIKETFNTPYSRPESPDVFISVADMDSRALNTAAFNTSSLG